MNRAHTIASVLSVIALVTFAQDTATIIAANATLKDGSTVKGKFCNKHIIGSTIFSDKLKLNPAVVKSIAFSGTNGESKVELVNGDKFAMTVANEALKINSLLGKLAIPRGNIRSIALTQRKVSAGGDDGLVFHCTFDDPDAITSPAVGPKGTYLRGSFVEGKSGNALQTTVYAHNATFELPSNFFCTSGCIEFWAKILKSSSYVGSGGDPRLFTITQKVTNNTICTLDIVSNNGGGNSGFSTWTILGNMASLRGCRNLRYNELFPESDYRDWHHYAIIWNKDGIAELSGSPKMALLIDGKLIPDIQGHARSTEDAISVISSPMLLSFTHDPALDPEHATKSPFLIDEFKIWSYPKTDFGL